jgi:hypothetical protein
MRKVGTFGAVLLAGLAFAALAASGAGATTKPVLVIKHEGTALAKGAPIHATFFSEGCKGVSAGTLKTNSTAKDSLATPTVEVDNCPTPEGATVSGAITSGTLSTTGEGSFKAKLAYTEPGPCVYNITTIVFKEGVENEGETTWGGEVTGKFTSKGSLKKGCAKTHEFHYVLTLSNEEFETLETEIT